MTFILMAAMLLAVAALASVAPALRILRMDPAETLRSE
jgi:ABC-type lipoprotein release transport system permease subunit